MKSIKLIIPIVLIIAIVIYCNFCTGFYLTIDGKTQHMNRYRIHKLNYDNKKEYDTILNDYLKQKYVKLIDSFKIKYEGKGLQNGGEKFEIYYDIKTPFTKNKFRIKVGYTSKKIVSDNFYEVLANDPKFNHLYSDWVKKQIGCEDKNIELKFANFNINKKMNIEFNNIKTIFNDYDELFENLTNYYLIEIYVKNIKELSEINYKQYADTINNKYFPLIVNLVGKSEGEHYVELFNNDINLLDINYHLLGKTDYSKVDIHYEVEYK